MARTRRLKFHGEDVYYHLISRTVGQEFYLGNAEKEFLMSLISYYSSLYFVKLIGFTILDNHFHIIIKSEHYSDYLDSEIEKRLQQKSHNKKLTAAKKVELLEKLSDISEYMKSIKENFSRWYNRENNRIGYFWGDRFKNIILEKGTPLAQCLAYVDLNAVRANIVERPEDYRWCSINARVNGTPISKLLYFTGVIGNEKLSRREQIRSYRKFLYGIGVAQTGTGKGKIPKKIADAELDKNFEITNSEALFGKIRHFSYGCAIGTEGFIAEMYSRFENRGIYKKSRDFFKTGISPGIFSLQRLKPLGY